MQKPEICEINWPSFAREVFNTAVWSNLDVLFSLDSPEHKRQLWTPEKLCWMFIVSLPIRYEMKPQRITDQAGISHDLLWNNELAFSSTINLQFSLGLHWKSYFLTTKQHQSLDSVCSEIECKLWKFATVQVDFMGEGLSATKKYGWKTTNHS